MGGSSVPAGSEDWAAVAEANDGTITLYGNWTQNDVTITFETNGGDKIDHKTVESGTTITPPTPTRAGYDILGWYTTSTFDEGTKVSNFNVNGSSTTGAQKLYAKFTPKYAENKNITDSYWLAAAGVGNENKVVKTQAEIKADIANIKVACNDPDNGTDAQKAKKALYESYMYGDDVHLITKYEGTDACNAADKYAEFRILQVGQHEAQGSNSNGVYEKDGTTLAFQAVHALPTACQMSNQTVSGNIDWSTTTLNTEMNVCANGSILGSFSGGFTDDIMGVTKYSANGTPSSTVSVNSSTDNKFWLASWSEVVMDCFPDRSVAGGSAQATYKKLLRYAEGKQYDYYKANFVLDTNTNSGLGATSLYSQCLTSSGNTAKNTPEGSNGNLWMRTSALSDGTHFMRFTAATSKTTRSNCATGQEGDNDVSAYDYHQGVVLCFAF